MHCSSSQRAHAYSSCFFGCLPPGAERRDASAHVLTRDDEIRRRAREAVGLGRIDGWAASTVYSTGFESDEGFDLNLKLSGQNGWKDSGFKGHGIVTNFLSDPGQQAYIGFNRPTDPGGDWEVWRPVDFRPQPGQSDLLTFSVRFAIHPSTTTNHDDFRWSAVNSEGTRLFSIDFDGNDHLIRYASSGGEFVKTEFG